jgi:hypothetical protein
VAAYFLDTSTILKRYVQETGTQWVQQISAPAAGHSLVIAGITLAEAVAAITSPLTQPGNRVRALPMDGDDAGN